MCAGDWREAVCLRTRPPSQAPQEAAPGKGLRCAALLRSAAGPPRRRAGLPPGAGRGFGGLGLPARAALRGGRAITAALSPGGEQRRGSVLAISGWCGPPRRARFVCLPHSWRPLLRVLPSAMVPAGVRPAPTRPAGFRGRVRLRLGPPGRRSPSPRALGFAVAPRPRGSSLCL